MPKKCKRKHATSQLDVFCKKRVKCVHCGKIADCLTTCQQTKPYYTYTDLCAKCSCGRVCPDISDLELDYFWKRPTSVWLQTECYLFPNDICQIIIDYYSPTFTRETLDLNGPDCALDFLQQIAKCWCIQTVCTKKKFMCDGTFKAKFLAWAIGNGNEGNNNFIFPNAVTPRLKQQISDKKLKIEYYQEKLNRNQEYYAQLQQDLSLYLGFEKWT